jgi:hypothetical protein
MYENRTMRPVETFLRVRGGKMKNGGERIPRW